MDRLSSKGQMISQIDLRNVPHSAFDLKNHNFLSGKLGKIIPTRVDELYPGDSIKGHIESVANFEPLAGPIMGSMVMKQESFYIPNSILWKNAHKFYTGKNGYNGHVPLVSPRKIYDTYRDILGHLPFSVLDACDELPSIIDLHATDFNTATTQFNGWFGDMIDSDIDNYAFLDYFKENQIEDLMQPFMDIYFKYIGKVDNVFYPQVGNGLIFKAWHQIFSSEDEWKHNLIRVITDFYYEMMSTLFGVSTLQDYLGFPTFDNWREYFYDNGLTDGGQYYNGGSVLASFYTSADYPMPVGRSSFTTNLEELFSEIQLNWLPFRAAYVCWYWNYRDELLEISALDPESDEFLADIPSNREIFLLSLLRVRCWYKDTFTTALTNTGDGNLLVPTSSPEASDLQYQFYADDGSLVETSDGSEAFKAGATVCGITIGNVDYRVPMNYFGSAFNNTGGVSATDTPSFLSLDLMDRIVRLRKFIQKKLILGYEYDDVLWSSFQVKLSNVRMRIPELLGQGRDAVQMNTIVNNTSTTEQDAGDKVAVAWANGRTSSIDYFVEEHGWFISFMTILPIQTYLGGMPRFYMKHEQFDMMWPEFATMGMDAVYNFELSAPRGVLASAGLSDTTALAVYGYQGRYYDLKSKLDEAHGRMRTDLRYMTFGREWNENNPPKLNYISVHCWPSLDMFVMNDPNEDVIRTIDVHHAIDMYRRLPVPSEFV